MKARSYRPIVIIDVAVPRDVEAAVGRRENVYLYNIDDLQQLANESLNGRQDSRAAAGRLVEQAAVEFSASLRQASVGPVIHQLQARINQLTQREWEWLDPKLRASSPQEKALVRQAMDRLVGKILHEPLRQLNEEGRSGNEGTTAFWAQILQRLFDLKD